MKHVISIMLLFNSDVQADVKKEKISAIKTGFGLSLTHIWYIQYLSGCFKGNT